MTPLFTRSSLANRYWSYAQLGVGGMGTVDLGVALQSLGISRLVAIKRPHSVLAEQEDFRAEFADEARMVARVRHPNVVMLVDVVTDGSDLAIVMEYIPGAPLDAVIRRLTAATEQMPLPI